MIGEPLPPNVTLYPIQLRLAAKLGLLKRVEYAWRMRRLFHRLDAREHFQIAHQLNPVFAGLSLGLIGSRVPIVLGPYVAHWPAQKTPSLRKGLLDTVTRVQQHFAAAIVLSGPAARERIVSRRVSTDKISIVPYGIDIDTFPEAAFPAGDPVILYLAALSLRKGITVLLEAFDLVAARQPTARLCIGGDGSDRPRIEAIAARSPYRDRITFAGRIAREAVPGTLAKCTVFCVSSYGEPYGMSLVEAMATGRPIVATNSGGPADLVDPQGGYLVQPGDAAGLAQALEKVIADPETARTMGAYNRQAILAFNWPNVIDRLERVYSSVAAPRDGPAHRRRNAGSEDSQISQRSGTR